MRLHTPSLMLAALLGCSLSLSACHGAAQREAKFLESGRKYLDQRNYDKARIEFGNAQQIDPRNAQAHYYAGVVAEKLGDPRQAAGQYQAAIDLNQQYVEPRAALARLFVLGGAPDRALDLVETGLAVSQNNPQLLTARAAARVQLGNLADAQADAESAVKQAPADEYAVSVLASLYKRKGLNDQALAVLRNGVQQNPKSVDLRVELADQDVVQHDLQDAETQLKTIVQMEPKNLEYRIYLVKFYAMGKNADAAEQTMRDGIAADPGNARIKLELVELLNELRGPEKADAQMEAFIAAEPNNDDLKLALADHLRKQGKLDQSRSVYQTVIDHAGLQPAGLTARDRLAAMAFAEKDSARASSLIDEVVKENPRDADALLLRAQIELAEGDAPSAITDLRSVLRDQPYLVPALRTLARAHELNSEGSLAEEALRTAAQASPQDASVQIELATVLQHNGKLNQARPVLDALVASAPDNLPAQQKLFEVEIAQPDLAAARATAESLKKAHPDAPLGFYLAGVADEQDQKLDAAAAEFNQALVLRPEVAEPLAALVRIDLVRKQPDKALQLLDSVIAKYPSDTVALNLKGELLMSQRQYDPAAQVYQGAILAQPQAWLSYQGLANAQLGLKHTDAAIEALKQGVEHNPEVDGLIVDLGRLYLEAGRTDDAIALYDGVLKRRPKSLVSANNLAVLLLKYRHDDASRKRTEELAALLENSPEPAYLDTRGWLKYQDQRYNEAMPLLQQAVDRYPQSAELRYHLGMAQFKSGDSSGALKNLELAANASESFPGQDEARQTLNQLKRDTHG